MRTFIRALSFATIVVLGLFVGLQPASAEPSATVEGSFEDVTAGSSYWINVVVNSTVNDPIIAVSGSISIAGAGYQVNFEVSPGGSGSQGVNAYISPGAYADCQANTELSYNLSLTYLDTSTNLPVGGANQAGTIPCRVQGAPIPVTVTYPNLVQDICGPGNDVYDFISNVSPLGGATLSSDPVWGLSTMYVQYVANEGYQLEGNIGFELTDNDPPCVQPVTISAPTIDVEFCGPNNDYVALGIITPPEGAVVENDSDWVDGERTISYVANSGFEIEGESSFTLQDSDEPCLIPVEIEPPALSVANCGPNNDVYVLHMYEGVSGDWIGDWANNTRTVTYTANQGYEIIGDDSFVVTDANFTCVSPVPPVLGWTVCGPDNDNIEFMDQPEGIEQLPGNPWQDNTFTVAYAPTDGYAFPPDVTGVYEFVDENIPCIEVTTVPPIHTEICGTNNDEITIPPQHDGVTHQIHRESPGVIEVEFDVDYSQYVWAADAIDYYRYAENNSECLTLIPPAVSAICGDNNDYVDIPDQGNVSYAGDSEWSDNRWNITFTADDGFMFEADTQTEYELVDDAEPCPQGVPVPPIQVEVCGPNNDEVVILDQPNGILVESSDSWSGGGWTVTFFAETGIVIPDDTQLTYDLIDKDTPCQTDAPGPPVQTAVCGPNNDEVTIPNQPENISVETSGEWTDGGWVVTFSAADGYVLPDGGQTVYNLVDEDTTCSVMPRVSVTLPDGGSAEGAPWQIFSPEASQVAQPPYAEGLVTANNTIQLPELLPGTYRLVVTVPGYELWDESITISGDASEITVTIAALQVDPTPTPTAMESPEPTNEPTTPTAEPTKVETTPIPVGTSEPQPTATAGGVSSLPETGTGTLNNLSGLIGLVAAFGLAGIWVGVSKRQGSN